MPGDTRVALLMETLARVAISVELQPTLQTLVESLRAVVPFDAGGIFVVDGPSHVVRAFATHGYPANFDVAARQALVGGVVRTGRPRIVPTVTANPECLPIRRSTAAQLTVPLASPRGIIGAIALESDRAAAFGPDDLSFVGLFAQQAVVAIERALLHEDLIRRSRIDREVEIAREILQGLLPMSPRVPGLDVFGHSLTAESVGGDAFDFIPYSDGQLGVSISDATGKGLPAALLAVAHQAMLHGLVSMDLRLRATFSRMNELLARTMPAGRFVTTFYGVIDVPERRMVYVNAGHPPPLVLRHTGRIELLGVTGPALGFPGIHPMREAFVSFEPGDGFVLFTDGVTDVGPTPDQFFDAAGVEATVRRLWSGSAAQVGEGLFAEARRHGGGAVNDDATVVVVKFGSTSSSS